MIALNGNIFLTNFENRGTFFIRLIVDEPIQFCFVDDEIIQMNDIEHSI